MSAPTWMGVAVLGGCGALARLLLDALVSVRLPRDLPAGTFAVNISGSFLLGLVTGLALTGSTLTMGGAAAIGSYTTFSTWMLETHRLREGGDFAWAFANIAVSLVVGLGAAALGRAIGAQL